MEELDYTESASFRERGRDAMEAGKQAVVEDPELARPRLPIERCVRRTCLDDREAAARASPATEAPRPRAIHRLCFAGWSSGRATFDCGRERRYGIRANRAASVRPLHVAHRTRTRHARADGTQEVGPPFRCAPPCRARRYTPDPGIRTPVGRVGRSVGDPQTLIRWLARPPADQELRGRT